MEASFFVFVMLFSVISSSSYVIDAGEVISERDRCPQCKGNKVTQEKKVLEVHVEKGMQQGQKIVFEGQADEAVSRNCYLYGLGIVVYTTSTVFLGKLCLKLMILILWWLHKLIEHAYLLQPDTITGDIVFVLQVKEHPRFRREYDDLFIDHSLSLTEALCGFQFAVTHLDGRQLLIKSNPGEVIKPGTNYKNLGVHLTGISFNHCIRVSDLWI